MGDRSRVLLGMCLRNICQEDGRAAKIMVITPMSSYYLRIICTVFILFLKICFHLIKEQKISFA